MLNFKFRCWWHTKIKRISQIYQMGMKLEMDTSFFISLIIFCNIYNLKNDFVHPQNYRLFSIYVICFLTERSFCKIVRYVENNDSVFQNFTKKIVRFVKKQHFLFENLFFKFVVVRTTLYHHFFSLFLKHDNFFIRFFFWMTPFSTEAQLGGAAGRAPSPSTWEGGAPPLQNEKKEKWRKSVSQE